jgi:chromosome segregation ATPase
MLTKRESMSEGYLKIIEQMDKEQKNFLKSKEEEIEEFNSKITNLERLLNESELKNKELQKDIDLLSHVDKQNQDSNLEDMLKMNELKGQLISLQNEIEEIKKDNQIKIKSYIEESIKLKEQIDNYEDRISEYKLVSEENNKNKMKLKELTRLKEKLSDYDNLLIIVDTKTKKIDSLENDKKLLLQTIEKNQKDLIQEKDKSRSLEFDKKRIESELAESKEMINRLESRMSTGLRPRESLVCLN